MRFKMRLLIASVLALLATRSLLGQITSNPLLFTLC